MSLTDVICCPIASVGKTPKAHHRGHEGTQRIRGMRIRAIRAFVFILLTCATGVAHADRHTLDAGLDSLYSVRGFEEVAISPDGTQVGWVQRLNSGGSGMFVSATNSPA